MTLTIQEETTLDTIEIGLAEIATKADSIDAKTRRIEALLILICDELMPDHPELIKIKKEIEQQG